MYNYIIILEHVLQEALYIIKLIHVKQSLLSAVVLLTHTTGTEKIEMQQRITLLQVGDRHV